MHHSAQGLANVEVKPLVNEFVNLTKKFQGQQQSINGNEAVIAAGVTGKGEVLTQAGLIVRQSHIDNNKVRQAETRDKLEVVLDAIDARAGVKK